MCTHICADPKAAATNHLTEASFLHLIRACSATLVNRHTHTHTQKVFLGAVLDIAYDAWHSSLYVCVPAPCLCFRFAVPRFEFTMNSILRQHPPSTQPHGHANEHTDTVRGTSIRSLTRTWTWTRTHTHTNTNEQRCGHCFSGWQCRCCCCPQRRLGAECVRACVCGCVCVFAYRCGSQPYAPHTHTHTHIHIHAQRDSAKFGN